MVPVACSVIIPVLNEEGSLPELTHRLLKTLDGLGEPSEVIFVDDGSTDGSFELLRQLHAADSRVKVIRLARNFGQHAALSAGIERARGEAVVILDADLQYDPEDIDRLLAKLREGHDLVTGRRARRQDKLLLRQLPSYLANRLIGVVTGVPLRDYNSGLKAFTAEVARRLAHYGEMRWFLGALLVRVARSVAEVEVSHHPRSTGVSKYGFLDLIGHWLDFVVSFPARLFQWIGLFGLASTGFGLLAGVLYLPLKFLVGIPLGPRTQFVILLAVVVGLQFAILGLLGEFLTRIIRLVERRAFFVVEEVVD